MWKKTKGILRSDSGMGTVELVIIVAVLVGIALIFRAQLFGFVQDITGSIFGGSEIREMRVNPTGSPQ